MANATPKELLESVYNQLGYNKNEYFLDSGDTPDQYKNKHDWIEKGEWLALAKEVGAEKIFFVKDNPVAVFARSDQSEPEILRKLYNKIWCMSRPRFLFLAYPGELKVYDLANEPAKDIQEWGKLSHLAVAKSINEVAEKLKAFRREQLETGLIFEEEELRFGDLNNRADKALINNLKEVRKELIEDGLDNDNIKYAHALIGRSIFIRYLEDREIIIKEDFFEVASKNKKWEEILKKKVSRSGLNLSEEDPLYARVLEDKDFTFALFKKLAKDFNGDMFPDVEQERKVITQEHLHLIRDLLFGDLGKQKKLFFYAYKFDIVPIELISSIYEEFYHPEIDKEKDKKSSQGAFYTPPALVEFLVNQVLTPEQLDKKPRVLDPSCGSGIFLVEAFRRIVRHRMLEQERKLSFQNLQKILREQIAGIEINPEAARIAAFSLYLSMLHYLDPPSIREQIYERKNRLPCLIYNGKKQDDESNQGKIYYNIILPKNAFDSEYIENNPDLKTLFSSNCADIVIGNPPWGGLKEKEAKEANQGIAEWCDKKNLPIGDQERSQAFIWKTIDSLKPDGLAGILVSTGVFYKHHKNSLDFRKKWLSENTLMSVFNFAHTRKIFFTGADSPFAAIIFSKQKPEKRSICYWTSMKTTIINNLHSVVFSKCDLKVLFYDIENLIKYQTWKILWSGNHNDYYLIEKLWRLPTLEEYSPSGYHSEGYTKAKNEQKDAGWLSNYKELPTSSFIRYGNMNYDNFPEAPLKVKRRGNESLYKGKRILIKRGISEKDEPKGVIVARYEEKPFCFRTSIHGVKIINEEEWKYKILLGILWSSLIRYYFFLTSSSWGIWHHEIQHEDELMQLPVYFPKSVSLKNRIVQIVDKLRSSTPEEFSDMFHAKNNQNVLTRKEIGRLEKELDQAIYKLYELNEAEIDLIHDMCEINLPYYYSPENSLASKPVLSKRLLKPYGSIDSLPENTVLSDYLKIFIQSWYPYLDEGTEFGWEVYQPEKTDSMIAVVFSVRDKNKRIDDEPENNIKSWDDVLTELENNITEPFRSSRIYIEGMARAVTEDFIMIIKRNERRLWTKSMAREDAEATLVQAMNRDYMKERIIHKNEITKS
jgi:type I restriction-modification system DNA methylase subunit